MDDQQQQRINRAAQEFTEALVATYGAASGRAAATQEVGARQIEHFFDAVIANLRARAGGNLEMTQRLASQQRLAREATRELAQVSTDNYMDLLDSVFSFYQGGSSRTQRRAEEAKRRIEEAEARAEQAEARAGEAERARSEAESQTEEAKRSSSVAKRRATEAEKRARESQSRAEEAEGNAEEAKGRAEQAESRAEEAQGESRETKRSLQEAQRRALEAESRAEEAERGRSEAESRGGDEEGDTQVDATSQPQSQWVRTSGRSKVRGRNTRARDRSSGRRR